jgi:hypothetical protein
MALAATASRVPRAPRRKTDDRSRTEQQPIGGTGKEHTPRFVWCSRPRRRSWWRREGRSVSPQPSWTRMIMPVQLAARQLPFGASFDPASGAFKWTPDAAQQGEYTVTLRPRTRALSLQGIVEIPPGQSDPHHLACPRVRRCLGFEKPIQCRTATKLRICRRLP